MMIKIPIRIEMEMEMMMMLFGEEEKKSILHELNHKICIFSILQFSPNSFKHSLSLGNPFSIFCWIAENKKLFSIYISFFHFISLLPAIRTRREICRKKGDMPSILCTQALRRLSWMRERSYHRCDIAEEQELYPTTITMKANKPKMIPN